MTESAVSLEADFIRERLGSLGPSDSFIVYDLEYTAWEGSLARGWRGEGEYRELVQIGAVKLANQPDYPEVDSFERLSRPEFNPELSAYFTELTGITDADLERDGQGFSAVMRDFGGFIGQAPVIAANGDDAGCLMENCDWRGVSMPASAGCWLNLRALFMTALNLPSSGTISSDLPERFGFAMEGMAHTGLADARAIAQALREVRRWENRQ